MLQSPVQLFLESAHRFPDREAIVHGENRIDYKSLAGRAGAIANFLTAEKLESGARVGILSRNTAEYAAVYYGVLSAGGVVVALNTDTKLRDLSNWIRHSGATWLFAETAHPQFPLLQSELGDTLRTVGIGGDGSQQTTDFHLAQILEQDNPRTVPVTTRGHDSLASIIYTSGTTGNPKGVMLSHRNLWANTRAINEYLGIGPDDRVMNILPFYYSYGNSVLHTHMAAGASMVLEDSLLFPHLVLERMVKEKVTGFSGVPATYSLLLNRTRLDEYDLSSLRYLTQAGGAMPSANIRRVRQAIPHADFYVMYGQTEATARLSYLPPDRLDEKTGSAGIPIPGVELGIFDQEGQQVAPGVTGEICARGPNIMMGYWKDPGMTGSVMRDGWLKTGDLAHMDEEGYIYISGRSSEMIKSGAHRINPAEVEEVVLEMDGIEEAAAIGVADELLGQVIKVVIVAAPDNTPDMRAIQAHCRKNMANFKIPKYIESVSEIPKTASGKIQRFLLANETTG